MKTLPTHPDVQLSTMAIAIQEISLHTATCISHCHTLGTGPRARRGWDGGPLPHDHVWANGLIRTGEPYVAYESLHRGIRRSCRACALAAGLLR